ncbi:MAG TPA: NUDIX domain-containing protein [Acidimicrobiia bacterium]|nr:NUDIX domain-containing protein [Acidimicrobiia bacterium]
MIAHPGGPYWARKDAGHWGVIKGEVGPGEDPLTAARREFIEETGWTPPDAGWIDLGSVNLRSGKLVRAYAVEADFDLASFVPGTFSMLWRGRRQDFPEIDRVIWSGIDEAHRLLNPAQVPLLHRLVAALGS